ncbi:Hsp33 family molecular chaperone HslO [Erythrobacter sp. SDW2]|uniref:Hsp33 family molecular chaperone HslO n=1 Tax=Erythrobacter sp. SDW2 TaxID=2907154 RepID=UPI001F471A23|nr:Hsp33 family molecular chaperone HslO [Erythrobacter sp. SDW2]UIP07151.1 Hsp33 family molecular chaperone HslO [Erythrobacter sp. SDW2]
MSDYLIDDGETHEDRLLTFTIPGRNTRGRVVRLGPVLREILGAHDYPPAITHLLAEALVVATLIGSLIKDGDGQMTMQAQTKGGIVNLLVCDFKAGAVRGYVDFDRERLASVGANPSLSALFGEGYLAVTFDMQTGEGRYQGVVPLEGDSLAQACETYFAQSEQVPTLIRVAVKSGADGCEAAGLLVQHLPDGEEGRERLHVRMEHPEWEHVAVMAGSIRYEELLDEALTMETLVWRLFHEEDEVRIERGAMLTRGCRCSAEHYENVLSRFPEDERAEMRDESGNILVDCAFCSRQFAIAL